MQTITEMFEKNVELGQAVFDLNRGALEAGLDTARKAYAANAELMVQWLKDVGEAKTPAAVVEAAVETGSKVSKLAAEQAGEAIENSRSYVKGAQDLAKKTAA